MQQTTGTRVTKQTMSVETWERIRHEYLMENRSIIWISEQEWAPSRPTVIKAVNHATVVRDARGEPVQKPPIKTLQPAVQSTLRASAGAARVLSVVEAAAAGDVQSAAEQAAQVLPGPTPGPRRRPPALPAHEPTGHPDDSSDASGVTPTTVLRELARLDGAQTLVDEAAMMRDGKDTAHDLLVLARAMVADGRTIQAKIGAALSKLEITTPMDVLLAVKINGTIALTADRATRVAQRVLQLERELLGDPREAVGASGAPGETFSMNEEEALAEARRCAHTLERYGVPFTVGSTAELPASTNQQDVLSGGYADDGPVFVAAKDDEPDDETADAESA